MSHTGTAGLPNPENRSCPGSVKKVRGVPYGWASLGAIGYGAKWLDATTATYANTAQTALDAFTALIADARAGRQIKG